MKCAILQPSYIPWRGYFHQIQKADVFVFYDDVQYDKHGWRNRNRIKTPQGSQWLTIPVFKKGNVERHREIREIAIDSLHPWKRKHLAAIEQSYKRTAYYDHFAPGLHSLYQQPSEALADFTIALTKDLAACLGIRDTHFVRSSELNIPGSRTERLIDIVKALRCDHYISGPSARAYLEEDKFRENGIELEYMEYNYPEYQQLFLPFDPRLSIIDLLMMTGPDAPRYIW